MKLIDADTLLIKVQELIKEYERRVPKYSANDMLTSGKDAAMKWGYKADGVEDVLKLIIDAPIIKAETIKHGRWIHSDDRNWLTCPFCDADVDVSVGILMYVDNDEVSHINFCPNCGARMDGDKE